MRTLTETVVGVAHGTVELEECCHITVNKYVLPVVPSLP